MYQEASFDVSDAKGRAPSDRQESTPQKRSGENKPRKQKASPSKKSGRKFSGAPKGSGSFK